MEFLLSNKKSILNSLLPLSLQGRTLCGALKSYLIIRHGKHAQRMDNRLLYNVITKGADKLETVIEISFTHCTYIKTTLA